jgi:hypothetical protein
MSLLHGTLYGCCGAMLVEQATGYAVSGAHLHCKAPVTPHCRRPRDIYKAKRADDGSKGTYKRQGRVHAPDAPRQHP